MTHMHAGRGIATVEDLERFEALPADQQIWTPASPLTVYEALARSAGTFGDRVAIQFVSSADGPARQVSYRDLADGVARAASVFAALAGPGCGVAYVLPSLVETHFVLWGAEACGYAVPINPLLQPHEIAELVRVSAAKIFVFPSGEVPGIAERLAAVRAAVPDILLVGVGQGDVGEGVVDFMAASQQASPDAARFVPAGREASSIVAYFHTGGTTGLPKLVAHSSTNQLCAAAGAVALRGLTTEEVQTNGMPLFHVGGTIASSLAPFLAGATVVMLSPLGFRNPEMVTGIWKIVERFKVTALGAVPTAMAAILSVPVNADISSLRRGLTGASTCPLSVHARFVAVTGRPLHEMLGMTESGGVTATDPHGGIATPGSVGLRLPFTSLRVRRVREDGSLGEDCRAHENGVLFVSGPHVSKGYLKPEQNNGVFIEGGLNTGDLAYFDEAGKLFISGRTKDLIIRSGHNIDPAAIEQALCQHPAVAAAAAVAQPDAYAGELPVAFVVAKPGADFDMDTLNAFARERISERPAWPKAIHVVDALPLTAVGKIYKPALRAEAAKRFLMQALEGVAAQAVARVDVVEGGKRGLDVTVSLSSTDAQVRDSVETFLSGFTFAWSVSVV